MAARDATLTETDPAPPSRDKVVAPRRPARARWWAVGVAALSVVVAALAVTKPSEAPLAPLAEVIVPEPPAANEEPVLVLDHEAGGGGGATGGTTILVEIAARTVPVATGSGSASGSDAGSDAGSGYKALRGEVIESYPGGVR